MEDDMPEKWLMLNYTLPREPSRLRVGAWRKLKKSGAVSIAQSMWVLPDQDDLHVTLVRLKNEIVAGGGTAFLMCVSVDEDTKRDFIARFGASRDEEYAELLEQCEDFHNEIEKETARRNFSFAEIEENEADLEKLKSWRQTILTRDFFGAALAQKSLEALGACEAEFEAFCAKVYENTVDLKQE